MGQDSIQIRKKNDTIGYVILDVVGKKYKYLNKPLSVLLSDLKFPVKSYVFGITSRNRNIVPYITFSFESVNETTRRVIDKSNPILLLVKFSTPLPMDSVTYFRSISKGEWLDNDRK